MTDTSCVCRNAEGKQVWDSLSGGKIFFVTDYGECCIYL